MEHLAKTQGRDGSAWLAEYLMESGKASPEQLASLRKKAGVEFADALEKDGLISSRETAEVFARHLHMKLVELDDDFALTRDEVALVPESVARRFCVIALKRNGDGAVTALMGEPLNLEAVDTVRSLAHTDVHLAVGDRTRIREIIDRFYSEEAYLEDRLEDIAEDESEAEAVAEDPSRVDDEQLKVLANDVPVVRFVNLVLMEAVRDGASDIHIEPGEKQVTVRLRIDGQLRVIPPPPKHLHRAIVTRIKILSNMDISERRLPQDGRFKFKIHGRTIDIRVSSLPEVHGEKVVLRILDRATLKTDMREIGFDEATIERYQRILRQPNGIILLTGPTGSGKTTTLYSALEYLRDPRRNIQTVEEPVEYQIDGINQMAVKPSIGLDFAHALRFILRQDPDTILIGEIRDMETAQIAMRASLTGHIVLSTLHTNDAPSAFWRLRDIGIPPYLIAATLRLVMSQRLVSKICTNCAEEYTPAEELLALACRVDKDAAAWKYMRGHGCPKCARTGTSGRTAIVEFLEVSMFIREKIATSSSDVEMKQAAIKDGMVPLIKDGLYKVRDGISSLEEVMSVCPIEYLSFLEDRT